jgi:hypothetical protein
MFLSKQLTWISSSIDQWYTQYKSTNFLEPMIFDML